ncbi:SagB family peptide dehydrogenase [Bradyrhizobium sp. Tv2a-2]|uniref:SagB/ThcOx family dehydrogenase n=1 Tax=Bradyrhizobium sp. Tv2a-2 TaxID=113395 RepID=UPI000A00736B|nr:SagB family peptide dehydrogenase [Bradyrhizobium sp. Tv2a-2]
MPRKATLTLSVRLNERVSLQAQPDGSLAAMVDSYPVELGRFSAQVLKRAEGLHDGLPLASFAGSKPPARETTALVRRLARRGFVEYRVARGTKDLVVIEPQLADYWPQLPKLRASDTIVLSRFAYMRRRADALVLESPRAAALFRICDSAVAGFLASLAVPRKIGDLKGQRGFPGLALLALLADCEILFTSDAKTDGLRGSEGDANLVMWDFHDLLFHTRSTEGRQANPIGGLYSYAGWLPPLPAERPAWPGKTIELSPFATDDPPDVTIATLLRERHSVRDFDETRPITLRELALFLGSTARVLSRWESPVEFDRADSPLVSYTSRPYPAAGSAYELELYLAVANCADLPRGFYHYDASAHALTAIETANAQLEAMLGAAQFAMDTATEPQVLITIAARFGRLSWKYAGIAYSLVLKDVGVLLQTLYLAATDMGLGGCAIGTSNIELFSKMTGLPIHVEGPVGVFALGREAAAQTEA